MHAPGYLLEAFLGRLFLLFAEVLRIGHRLHRLIVRVQAELDPLVVELLRLRRDVDIARRVGAQLLMVLLPHDDDDDDDDDDDEDA